MTRGREVLKFQVSGRDRDELWKAAEERVAGFFGDVTVPPEGVYDLDVDTSLETAAGEVIFWRAEVTWELNL